MREWRYSSILDGCEWSVSRPRPLYPRDRAPDTHCIEELLPGIELRLFCCPVRRLVTVLTKLTALLLLCAVVSYYYYIKI